MLDQQYTQSLLNKLRNVVSVFHQFELDEIVWFLEHGTRISVAAATTVIKKDAMGDAFYIILNGQMEVFDYKPDQSINSFAVLKTGSMVGEVGAVLRQPRTAFVRTRTACCLLRYSGTFFDTVEVNRPDLAVKIYKSMLRVLGDRIKHQNELLHGDITGGEGQ